MTTKKNPTPAAPTDDVQVDALDQQITLEQLATRKVKLRDEKAAIDEEIALIDAQILDVADTGTTPAGPFKVIVTEPERLDTAALSAAFPVAQHPELYKAVLDTTAVKDRMSPVQLSVFRARGRKQVTVR